MDVIGPVFMHEVGRLDMSTRPGELKMDGVCKPNAPKRPRASRWPHGRRSAQEGVVLVLGYDQRNPWVHRCRDLIRAHLIDLGGEEDCSVAERSLVRRACALTVELEFIEGRWAQAGHAEPRDLDLYTRTATALKKILEVLGTKRRARTIGGNSSLEELLTTIDNMPLPPDPDDDDPSDAPALDVEP